MYRQQPTQVKSPVNKIYQAISLVLLTCVGGVTISINAHGATVGAPNILSSQYEPLNASIEVRDIDADTFSASLASPDIYNKMGLQPTDSMTVRFVPNGKDSGRIIINTSKPISAPFTDVVLNVRDKDSQQVVPKTLLMPLAKSAIKVTPNTQVVTNKAQPNLPVVSQPLEVKRTPPPPLSPAKSPNDVTASTTNPPASIRSPSTELDNRDHNGPDSTNEVSASTNKQAEILNTQVLGKIKPQGTASSNSANTSIPKAPSPDLSANNVSTSAASKAEKNKKATPKASSSPASSPTKAASQPKASTANKAPAKDNASPSKSTATYTVQRNDNLWTIADELARKNNLDVQTVMKQIHEQNPDAFINQEARLLKADAKLALPNYEVIPSQQSLQAAVQARRAQLSGHTQDKGKSTSAAAKKTTATNNQASAASSTKTSKPASASNAKNNTNQVAANKPAPTADSSSATQTVTKTLPKARMTVIAPGKDGSADGTQTKASAATGSGLNTDMLATLKASRLRTATQAKKVREINQQLSSYTQKLQLQNQRLAELEARLKELRKNK